MSLRTLRFITLLLAALGLTLGAAHGLELIPKLRYDDRLYMEVTRTLYRFYGLVGGPVQVLALVAAAWLSFRLRGRPAFRLTSAGASCLGLSLALWAGLVQPVNAAWGQVLTSGTEAEALDAYARLRGRWEYGHVAAFIAWLAGVSFLLLSVLSETPREPPAVHEADRRRRLP
jgi:hypothetical protein